MQPKCQRRKSAELLNHNQWGDVRYKLSIIIRFCLPFCSQFLLCHTHFWEYSMNRRNNNDNITENKPNERNQRWKLVAANKNKAANLRMHWIDGVCVCSFSVVCQFIDRTTRNKTYIGIRFIKCRHVSQYKRIKWQTIPSNTKRTIETNIHKHRGRTEQRSREREKEKNIKQK